MIVPTTQDQSDQAEMESRKNLHDLYRHIQDVDTDKFGSPDYRAPHDFLKQKIGSNGPGVADLLMAQALQREGPR